MKLELTTRQAEHLAHLCRLDASLYSACAAETRFRWMADRARLDCRLLEKLAARPKRKRGRKPHASQLTIMRRKLGK